MDATAAPDTAVPGHERPASDRWYHGVGRAGVAVVVLVAALVAFNTTVKFLVSEPLGRWATSFAEDLLFDVLTGFAILLAVVWARHRVPRHGARQYALVAGAVLASTFAMLVVGDLYQTSREGGVFWWEPGESVAEFLLGMVSDMVRYAYLGMVIAAAWLYLQAEGDHVAAMAQCALDGEEMDRQTAEARLQMLEAQIEPHFLFNTLANVRRLYETDPSAGAHMLRHLQSYLAVALPELRAADSTLGRELDHAAAYLLIQQIRMNRRLAFAIEVPQELRAARMPSLMVLTLVENAIKHGLAPLPEGGRVDVRATSEGGRLRVQVADTGRGFAKSSGGGTGLANTRARLASYHGARASFMLAANTPRGVLATIELPYEGVATRAAA